jgi:membrane associated rhomboid family serine protease
MIPIGDEVPQKRPFPIFTVLLLLANVLVFLFELTLSRGELSEFVQTYGFVPAKITGWREWNEGAIHPLLTLLTAMFVHGGFIHILGNMLYLWVFADNVEGALGHFTYLAYYLLCGVAASLVEVAISPASQIPGVGASGAIAGVLAAYLLLFPHARVRTLLVFGPFLTFGWVAAVVLIGFWFVLQVLQGVVSLALVTYESGGVALFAHIGGFLFGFLLTYLIRRDRGQPVAEVDPRRGFLWNAAFRNWVILVVWVLLMLGVAAAIGAFSPGSGSALRMLALLVAGVVAALDAVRRIAGKPAALSQRGLSRVLAVGQLFLAVGVFYAAFQM